MAILDIAVDQLEGKVPVTILRVEGEVYASTQNILQDKAAEVIAAGASNILIDLSGVNYMGSAGFKTIHAITNMLDDSAFTEPSKSRHLKLLGPTDTVSRVIETLGFDVYLEIFHDQDEAVNSF